MFSYMVKLMSLIPFTISFSKTANSKIPYSTSDVFNNSFIWQVCEVGAQRLWSQSGLREILALSPTNCLTFDKLSYWGLGFLVYRTEAILLSGISPCCHL